MTRKYDQRDQLTRMLLGMAMPANVDCKYPLYNTYTKDGKHYVDILAPGLEKENVKVTLKSSVLKVQGEYEGDDREYAEKQFSTKDFCREFCVGREYEVTKVTLKHGILTIELSKESDEDYILEIE